MRLLIFGAGGFIGRYVKDELSKIGEVYTTTRRQQEAGEKVLYADLYDEESVGDAIRISNPDVIVSCAGVIGKDAHFQDNVLFTRHILEQASRSQHAPRVILSGSASSYGFLKSEDELPVKEETPLRAERDYGLSKRQEEEWALEYARDKMEVVVVRLFNPIGIGMGEKFLIPNVIKQMKEGGVVNVSRLDAARDYIDVHDVAKAYGLIAAAHKTVHNVYNVGSGRSVSSREIIEMLGELTDGNRLKEVVETQAEPEHIVASQADIRRIRDEFDWSPRIDIEETLKDIMQHGS